MVVLVTGCSSGFGARIARKAAEGGHTVYAGLRDLSEPGDLPAHDGVCGVQLDVTDPAQRDAVRERILAEQGRLDVLVNNAGVVLGGFLEQVDDDELRRVFEVNVFGAWSLTRALLPALRASSGLVVNLSSISGLRAFPGLGAYAASKFALEGLTEALHQELKPLGVKVCLVEPGTYSTAIWGANKNLSRRSLQPDSPYAEAEVKLGASFETNAQKAGDPEEIADAVVGLFGQEAPPLRTLKWGTRRTSVLFRRVHRQLAPEIE